MTGIALCCLSKAVIALTTILCIIVSIIFIIDTHIEFLDSLAITIFYATYFAIGTYTYISAYVILIYIPTYLYAYYRSINTKRFRVISVIFINTLSALSASLVPSFLLIGIIILFFGTFLAPVFGEIFHRRVTAKLQRLEYS